MVFAAGGSRMGATTITNATHDGKTSDSADTPGAAASAGGAGQDSGLPAYLSSPLSAMDNTDGWGLQADSQLVMFAGSLHSHTRSWSSARVQTKLEFVPRTSEGELEGWS
jgi:hypothetical protein